MALIIVGALLVIAGVVVATISTLRRGRLSEPQSLDPDTPRDTLEPTGRGRRLSLRADLPGIALAGIGVLILIIGAIVKNPG